MHFLKFPFLVQITIFAKGTRVRAPSSHYNNCRPFVRSDPDAYPLRGMYADWIVDGVRLYRSSGDGSFGLNVHHFVVAHAFSNSKGPRSANFVFEVPLLKGCFGDQNIHNAFSHTVGFLDNSMIDKRGFKQRMARVLQYDEIDTPPHLNADGFQADNDGRSQVPNSWEEMQTVLRMIACVQNGQCEPITIADLITLSREVLKGQDWNEELLGQASILPWDAKGKSDAKEGMTKLVEDWAAVGVRDDVVSENAYYPNKINCRSFSYMLKYAIDAVAFQRLELVHKDALDAKVHLEASCHAAQNALQDEILNYAFKDGSRHTVETAIKELLEWIPEHQNDDKIVFETKRLEFEEIVHPIIAKAHESARTQSSRNSEPRDSWLESLD